MHGQDPKVAEKRGIRGPAAINLALANQHLQGPNAKGNPNTLGNSLAGPPFSPMNPTRGPPTMPENNNNNALPFDQRAQVDSSMTSAQLSSPDQSRGFSFNHDNGLGFGGSVSPAAASTLAANLPLQQKRHMRVKRGEFAGFDRYRGPRLAANKAGTTRATTPLSGRSRPGTPGFATVNGAKSSLAGATTTTSGGLSNKTINGVRVPSARYPYRGDTVKSLSEESAAKSSFGDRERLLTYVADVYQQHDAHRAERIALEQRNRRQRDACGHAITGRAVLWRTDAGEPLATPHEVLVPAGPVYWDASRAHLHELAFADDPPALGRPRPSSSSSSRESSLGSRAQFGRETAAGSSNGSNGISGGARFNQSEREESSRPSTANGAFARSSSDLPSSPSSPLSRFGFTPGPPVGSPPAPTMSTGRPSSASSTAAEGEWWLEDEGEVSSSSAAAALTASDAAAARRRMRHRIAKSSAPRSAVFMDHSGPAHAYERSKHVSEERRGASRPLMTHHNN